MSRLPAPKLYVAVLAAAAALAAVLVGVSLVGADDAAPEADAGAGVLAAEETEALFAGIPQDGLVLGDPDAPVTLVEYADVQCPYCAQWAHDAFPAVVEEYVRTGKVKVEFRGLAFIGPESELGLRTLLAASEQDRLWPLLHLLFASQGPENGGWLTEDALRTLGAAVPGLDVDRALDARGSDAVERLVAESQERAEAARVPGTPAFEAGSSGGELELLRLESLGPEGIRPHLDALLAG